MLRAVSAKERAHIDQASKEAVRLLIIVLLLLLLALTANYIKLIIADRYFPCIPEELLLARERARALAPIEGSSGLPRCLYSPNCRQKLSDKSNRPYF